MQGGVLLESAWLQFASSPAALSIRPVRNRADERLLEDLERLRRFFGAGAIHDRYLRLLAAEASEQRQVQWAESRRSVIEVLDSLISQGASREQIRLSLSHTADATLAVGVGDGTSIGVDIEGPRTISQKALERFSEPGERALEISPVQLWAVKEACFKSDPENEQTFVSQYRILRFEGSERLRGKVVRADRRFQFRVVHFQNWDIAFAKALT